MAVAVDLPILLIEEEGVKGGLFEPDATDPNIYRVALDADPDSRAFTQRFRGWCAAVREKAS